MHVLPHQVLDHIRTIPLCMAMGQAAGTAVALSVKGRIKPRSLDPNDIQICLYEQGAILK